MNQTVSSLTGNTFQSVLLPISIRVVAQTIGMNLVSVQPLSSPIGKLNFIDFSVETEEQKAIRKRKERKEKYDKIFGSNRNDNEFMLFRACL